MVSTEKAESFASDWVAAWNSHDLDRILAHYAEDIVFSSPFAADLVGAPDGVIAGLPALRAYFARGLEAYPDLHFELIAVLPGASSIAMHYRSVGGREAIEIVELDAAGLVRRAAAHYSAPAAD